MSNEKIKFVKKYRKDIDSFESLFVKWGGPKNEMVGYDIIYENTIMGSIIKATRHNYEREIKMITSFNEKTKKKIEKWVLRPSYYYVLIVPNPKKREYDTYNIKDLNTAKKFAKYLILKEWGETKVLKTSKKRTGKIKSKKLDSKRKALPPGKRISKFGKIYYEYRKNRSDIGKI